MFGIRSPIVQAFKGQISFKQAPMLFWFAHLLAEPAYMEGAARRETVCARQLPGNHWVTCVLLILFILYSMLMMRSNLYWVVQANATTMIYYFIGMCQFHSFLLTCLLSNSTVSQFLWNWMVLQSLEAPLEIMGTATGAQWTYPALGKSKLENLVSVGENRPFIAI
jgi:hypothetical protein